MKWMAKWGALALAALIVLAPASLRAQDEDEGLVEVEVVDDSMAEDEAMTDDALMTDEVGGDEAAEAMDAVEGEELDLDGITIDENGPAFMRWIMF